MGKKGKFNLIDLAIKNTYDARLYGGNATQHIIKHSRQMGMSPKKYLEEAEKLSLAPANKIGKGGIEGYISKSGRKYKYDTAKQWLVAYQGNAVITFTPYRLSQWVSQYKANYEKDI